MGSRRELPARRKDGSEFIIQLRLVEVDVPVEHGDERMFCGFILDLTEQKRLVSKMKQERNLVQSILNATLDPLFQINEHGIIQLVNKAATTQFGWTRDEFIGVRAKWRLSFSREGRRLMRSLERVLVVDFD